MTIKYLRDVGGLQVEVEVNGLIGILKTDFTHTPIKVFNRKRPTPEQIAIAYSRHLKLVAGGIFGPDGLY